MLTRFPFGSEETKRRTKKASVISKNGRKKIRTKGKFQKGRKRERTGFLEERKKDRAWI